MSGHELGDMKTRTGNHGFPCKHPTLSIFLYGPIVMAHAAFLIGSIHYLPCYLWQSQHPPIGPDDLKREGQITENMKNNMCVCVCK